MKPEELSKYRQVASHVVSGWRGPTVSRTRWTEESWEMLLRSLARCLDLAALLSCHAVGELVHPGSQPSWMDKG